MGTCSYELLRGRTSDDFDWHARLDSANLEIVDGALGLCAPVHIVGNIDLAHCVRFDPEARIGVNN